MNLKQLLNDLENLEKNIDSETVMEDVKSDLVGCIHLLKDIMGDETPTEKEMRDYSTVLIENQKQRDAAIAARKEGK